MTTWSSVILIFALFAATVGALRGADEPAGKPALRDERKKLSPEERDAWPREWRKTNAAPSRAEREKMREQFRNMTPEEREAKRRELKGRLEKRIAELRSRQTNATLTPQESRELERREQILRRFEQNTPGSPHIDRTKPVFTNEPAKN